MHHFRVLRLGLAIGFFLANGFAQQPGTGVNPSTEARLKEALSAAERTSGVDGAPTATALANLGQFYLASGRRDDAEPLLQRAIAIVDRNSTIAPVEQARILTIRGDFYFGVRSPNDAEKYLERAAAILQRELGADNLLTIRVESELGGAYVMWGAKLDKAAPLIERATTNQNLRGLPAQEIRARLGNLAQLRFWQHDHVRVQETIDRILASPSTAPIPADETEALWELSADSWIRTGEFAKAEARYRQILDSERKRSADPGSDTLYALAGLAMDQGRYKESDALYREALQDGLRARNGTSVLFDIGRDWANLRRDLGREAEAVALEKWVGDNQVSSTPPPSIAQIDIPTSVRVAGLTPNQMLHRLTLQYGDDLSVLWKQLEIPPGDFSKCYFCGSYTAVTLADGTDAVIVRMKNNEPPARRLLFLPTGRNSGGVREWRVSGILDLPFSDRVETQRTEKSKGKTWLVLDVRQSANADRGVEEWYEITDGQFRKTTAYPAGAPSKDSYVDSLLQQLHAASPNQRITAVDKIAAIPDALTIPRVAKELVDLLERENAYVMDRYKAGTGVGEDYGEYVSNLLGIVFKAANLQDRHTLEVLAYSSYNDDSRFAKDLADGAGGLLIPIAMSLLKTGEPTEAWNGIGLLAHLYEKRESHGFNEETARSLKQTIVDTTNDSDTSMRMTAVRYLGQIGSTADLSLLQQLADSAGDPIVRKYAVTAMESIRNRDSESTH